jgi:hypothetical protein
MVSKIGFFHFGKNHAYPIEEVLLALEAKGRKQVESSLIVLPEGFNIRSRYSNPTAPYDYNPSVLSTLRDVAKEWSVVFVAGLIVDTDNHLYPPYNAAYLVDGISHKLICYKKRGDNWSVKQRGKQGYPIYTEHEQRCNPTNPIVHDDVFISAFICMDVDALLDETDERNKTLRDQSRANGTVQLICVPASAGCSNFSMFPGKWPDHYFVVTDSGSQHQESFIARGSERFKSVSGDENEIELHELTPKSPDTGQGEQCQEVDRHRMGDNGSPWGVRW